LTVCAGLAAAQPSEDPARVGCGTRAEIERLRGLVASAPRRGWAGEKAEAALEDAQDAAILRKTIYGSELRAKRNARNMLAAPSAGWTAAGRLMRQPGNWWRRRRADVVSETASG